MAGYTFSKWKAGRHWAVYAPDGVLVCVCLYRRGARHLAGLLTRLAG